MHSLRSTKIPIENLASPIRTFPFYVTSLAAFLLPALALWIRSGPSYGAALLLVGSLCFFPLWTKRKPVSGTWALAMTFLGMAVLWYELTTQQGINQLDRPLKWALGALCLFYAAACPPRATAFFLGLPIGCLGMGGLALWQVLVQGMERATGFTNAIPWGDTALLLACFTGVFTALFWRENSWIWRVFHIVSVIAGVCSSLLSHSRGGWMALSLAFAMLMLVTWQLRAQIFIRLFAFLSASSLILIFVLASVPQFRDRVDQAATEINQYFDTHQVNTSLGIRLEQYRLAFNLIPEKPLLGWGRQGFVQETERRVTTGEYDPAILGYRDYIHNELLDSWVKTGVLGALLQLTLYGLPLFLFWPSPKRMAVWPQAKKWRQILALRIMGSLMGLMYFGFGMTMPYFAHNSGTVFFIFCLICLWSALQGLEREASGEERT